jgi:hypothetical protein
MLLLIPKFRCLNVDFDAYLNKGLDFFWHGKWFKWKKLKSTRLGSYNASPYLGKEYVFWLILVELECIKLVCQASHFQFMRIISHWHHYGTFRRKRLTAPLSFLSLLVMDCGMLSQMRYARLSDSGFCFCFWISNQNSLKAQRCNSSTHNVYKRNAYPKEKEKRSRKSQKLEIWNWLYAAVLMQGIKEKKAFQFTTVLSRSSKLWSFVSFHIHHIMQDRNIFHNAALWTLPNWPLPHVKRSTTRLGMTQSKPNRPKNRIP